MSSSKPRLKKYVPTKTSKLISAIRNTDLKFRLFFTNVTAKKIKKKSTPKYSLKPKEIKIKAGMVINIIKVLRQNTLSFGQANIFNKAMIDSNGMTVEKINLYRQKCGKKLVTEIRV